MAPRNHQAGLRWGVMLMAALAGGCGGGGSTAPVVSEATTPSSSASSASSVSTTPTAVLQAESEKTPVDAAIVAADNGFGLTLFQTLQASTAENIAISPLSMSVALQILYNGALGATQQGMAQTLQLGALSVSDLNADNAALQASLLTADPLVTLIIANSLWTQSSSTVLPSFTLTDTTYYGATLGDLSGAPANVNAWVAAQTQGLIAAILPAGNYSTVVAVLANALYFKAPWSTAFDPSQTSTQPFTLSDGSQTSVPTMHQSGLYAYFQGSNFQALSLPYGSGRLSMLIILPAPGVPLASFIAGLTLDALTASIGALTPLDGSISLPRFTASYQAPGLSAVLGSLGMSAALCAPLGTGANFSALASQPVCVSDAEHATVVQVDEAGTVAAAATTITVGITLATASSFSMSMDRPFLYALRDGLSGELLFLGALMNPT